MTVDAERAFQGAIEAIEAASSVEVVVAVRPRVRRWLVAHLVIGMAVIAAMLAFALFSDVEFELWAILVLPLVAGVSAVLAIELIAPLERAVVPASRRAGEVREAARAAFTTLGVHATQGRTGLLVFLAIRERSAALVGDTAVIERVDAAGLERMASTLAAALPSGGSAVATALAALAGELGKALPRATDDINELADLVHVIRPGAPRRFRGAVR
jgi:putative membrane protein